jgi:peptide/nickel transport system permease protein
MASLVRAAARHPAGIAAGVVLLAAAAAALAADAFGGDPLAQDIPRRLRPPGPEFVLGSDGFGRDLLSRMLHGLRLALGTSAAAVGIALAVGASLGMASAYAGGKTDLVAQRVVDALLGFPPLVLALVVTASRGPSAGNVVFALALAFAPQFARLARAQALAALTEDFVLAARASGAGGGGILLRHVVPHTVAPLLTLGTGYLGAAITAETALGFLGFGVPPPEPSFGNILQDGARRYLEAAPWLTVFPSLAVAVLALCFALVGDAARDVLDPRLRHAGRGRTGV